MTRFETTNLPDRRDAIAPDGSAIRLLACGERGSLVHCTLPPGATSLAVAHKTVEEIWYFVQGRGEVRRKRGEQEEVVAVGPGVSLTIPTGAHFQFRNTGAEPLCFLCVTMPPWPGAHEAYRVADYWPVDS